LASTPRSTGDPARAHPGADTGQVRLEVCPEPRERRQPWLGNSVSFSAAAVNRAGLCACPSLPALAHPEKITFPPAGNPEQTHTRHCCVFPARGGGRQAELCALKHRTAPVDPQTRPQRHGPRHRAPKPTHGAVGSRTGPPATGPGTDAPGGTGPPQPGGTSRGCPAAVAQPDFTTAAASLARCRARPRAGHSPVPSWGRSTSCRLRSKLLPTAEILPTPR